MEEKQNRLLELRKERGMSQKEAAKTFYVSQATYHNWETAKTEPNIQQLIKLSDFFDVSVDYLVGRTEAVTLTKMEDQLSTDEQRLFRAFHNLAPRQKNALLAFLESLS